MWKNPSHAGRSTIGNVDGSIAQRVVSECVEMAFGACCDILAGAQTHGSSNSSVGSVTRASRKGDYRDATRRTRRRRGEMQNAVHDAFRRELDVMTTVQADCGLALTELQAAYSLASRAYVLRADAARQKCLARIRLAADESNVAAALDEMSEALQHAETKSLRMVVAAREPAAASSRQRWADLRGALPAAAAQPQGASLSAAAIMQDQKTGRAEAERALSRVESPTSHEMRGTRRSAGRPSAGTKQAHSGPRAAAGTAGAGAHGRRGSGTLVIPGLPGRFAQVPSLARGRADGQQGRLGGAGGPEWPDGQPPVQRPRVPQWSPPAGAVRSGAVAVFGRCRPVGAAACYVRGPAASWVRAAGRAGGRRRSHNPPGRPPGLCQG